MRKLLLVSAALAFSAAGAANAADLPVKAAPMAPAYAAPANWTGCYVGAGGGYGMWNQDHNEQFLNGTPDSGNQTSGGRGWFGTVQVGCDYQVSPSFLIGAFADFDWSSIKGDTELSIATFPFVGSEKLSRSFAAGARIGWLPTDRLLTFVSGGYTQARFDGYNLSFNFANTLGPIFAVNPATRDGWFIGSGYEYALGWLPGVFWKTEYRFGDYGTRRDNVFLLATGAPFEITESHKYVQTIRSELVWRFNWAGPARAAY